MPVHSDEDAVETVPLESSNANASTEADSHAIPSAATTRRRAAQAAVRGFTKRAAPDFRRRRSRVQRCRRWGVSVVVLFTFLFAAQVFLMQTVSGPVVSLASVGTEEREHWAAARQQVASSTAVSRKDVVDSSKDNMAVTSVIQDCSSGEQLPPTAESVVATASAPSNAHEVMSSKWKRASLLPHGLTAVANLSDNAEGDALETPATPKTPC
ncbi:hypothetical protein LSCM1_06539 [Leishmania martiniquensis]|uniref:Transmembrane protein n=1 Tax=Leishmania martiniquensis TaxID=1580590 RepID=A0A836HXM0_9TRYP|nr:hypothetical protein LSCM1_06539 [Leishmania martiniquensis]